MTRQEDDLRYSRLSDIIQIVTRMQGTSEGLTLDEVAKEIDVSTRTATRMIAAIMRNFPQIGLRPSNDNHKRWGFKNSSAQREFLSGLIGFKEDEILELEKIKKSLKNKIKSAEKLDNVIKKIKALMRDTRNEIQTDNIKALLEYEGYAINQISNIPINESDLQTTRKALISKKYLSFKYTDRSGKNSKRIVAPYGILYNYKNYLVAKDGEIKLFDFDKINNLMIEEKTFAPDKNFNLEDYANRSFGIYQEKPLKIKLLFDKQAANDAKRYYFHPTQKIKELENGEIEIQFEAGGTKAVCWELFKWGEHVKILNPPSLKKLYKNELEKIIKIQEN